MTALKNAPRAEPEVLIEEARRRQRRRRASVGAVAVLLALGFAVWLSGGGPPSRGGRGAGDGRGPAAAVGTGTWHDLTAGGDYIAPGAQVTSVIRWRGRLIAAGDRPGTGLLGCYGFCNPVVWSDVNRRWTVTYAAVAEGGLANERLVPVGRTLLLWQSQEGNQVFRSANGRSWRRVTLPGQMPALPMQSVASDGTRLVAVLDNRYAGGPDRAYGELNPVWTTTDGIHWRRGLNPRNISFYDVSADPAGGFVATGSSAQSRHWFVLLSVDGRVWSTQAVATSPGWRDQIAASRNGMVLESVPDRSSPSSPARFWYSTDGRRWIRAKLPDGSPTNAGTTLGTMPKLLVLDGEFVALDNDNTHIWWSEDGQEWQRLAVRGAPPASSQPSGATVERHALLMVESSRHRSGAVPAGATTFWRLAVKLP